MMKFREKSYGLHAQNQHCLRNIIERKIKILSINQTKNMQSIYTYIYIYIVH